MLTQIEKDFISFLSEKLGETPKSVEERYLHSKNTLNFGSISYKNWCRLSYGVLNVFFHDATPESTIDSYQHFAYPDTLRMLSYSFPKSVPTVKSYIRAYAKELHKVVRDGNWSAIFNFIGRKIRREKQVTLTSPATFLIEHSPHPISIVDYGCGLGYLSFEIAQTYKVENITLVDIDSIKLDFAEYRFRQHGLNPTVIRITKDNLYPSLPPHTVCIATEVMEHLHESLKVFTNIQESLKPGGLFYGDVHDHESELFHVHPDLADVRAALDKDFEEIGRNVYRKK